MYKTDEERAEHFYDTDLQKYFEILGIDSEVIKANPHINYDQVAHEQFCKSLAAEFAAVRAESASALKG